jgi:hypothetical protein
MKIIKALVDNSTMLTGLLTATIGLLTVFFPDALNKDQIAAIMVFAGALISFLSVVLTTAKRRVVSTVNNDGLIVNGAAAVQPTGAAANVSEDPQTGLLTPQTEVKPELLNVS